MAYQKKIMLLGSGELGKEVVIALQRLGQYVIAVDGYAGAPAMQVAHEYEVIDMLNAAQLDAAVAKHQPHIIVPEIEAIRTEQFYNYEQQGIQVVPSAKAANFTMNRRAVRNLAAQECGLRTARYEYASTLLAFAQAVKNIGIPCVVKPLMSSSGKGQSVLKNIDDVEKVWQYAMEGSRGDVKEVIVEEFIPFESEITLLTVTQQNGNTLFCPPIGHRQERGDYQESWQPCAISEVQLLQAQEMAATITKALGGAGLWGVEFFLTKTEVIFSELSPRPHDTGMVTLAGTQNLSEFELHARAILGLPITGIEALRSGASAVVLAKDAFDNFEIKGVEKVLAMPCTDVRIFGKPTTRPYRRMGVVLLNDSLEANSFELAQQAKQMASYITIEKA